MTARSCAWVAIVVAIATATANATPSAQVVTEAQRRFKRANVLYNDGKYADALLLYQAAYDLVPSISVLFNLGLTKEKLLDFEGCALAFQQYLRDAGADSDSAEARRRSESCRDRASIAVKVTSLPPGAALAVATPGGARLLDRAPATLQLAPGTHELRLELGGYESRTERIEVEIGQRPTFDFVLVRLASLRIEANIAGASVRVNGGPPEAAPVEREVQAGDYSIEVSRAGHESVRRSVHVASGKEVQVSVSLSPLPELRTVSLRSTPGQSSLTIDGAPIGGENGRASTRLAPGSHVLVAAAPGFLSLRDTLVVPSGRDVDLVIRLSRERSRRSRLAVWGLASAAGVFGIVGGAYGIAALRDEADYGSTPSRSLRDSGLDHRQRADVLLGGALLCATAATIYYLATRPSPHRLEVRP